MDEWLRTNEYVDTVETSEFLAEQLQNIKSEPHRWKWVIIILHNLLQGMMVLALKGSHGLNVLFPKDQNRWLEAHGNRKGYPDDLKLNRFPALYKMIKSDEMLMYVYSSSFQPKPNHDSSVALLNSLRNDFIHFTPKSWSIELRGLPTLVLDCLDIAEFLSWESKNVFWSQEELADRIRSAFVSAREACEALHRLSI